MQSVPTNVVLLSKSSPILGVYFTTDNSQLSIFNPDIPPGSSSCTILLVKSTPYLPNWLCIIILGTQANDRRVISASSSFFLELPSPLCQVNSQDQLIIFQNALCIFPLDFHYYPSPNIQTVVIALLQTPLSPFTFFLLATKQLE